MQLHITNGDVVGDMLVASQKLQGQVLCWRDVLHDGPIIAAEGPAYLRARAHFIYTTMSRNSSIAQAELNEQTILDDFVGRQLIVDKLSDYSEIVLWFEHDLYDQLQLAECLYQLAKHPYTEGKVTLICISEHAELSVFHGLGNLNLRQLEALYPQRHNLSIEQITLGRKIWLAIASDTPIALSHIMSENLVALPFMATALMRFAQEYPSTVNGLSLTQQRILQALAEPKDLPERTKAEQQYQPVFNQEGSCFGRLFANLQSVEDTPFLGDTWLTKELLFLARLKPAYVVIVNPNGNKWDQQASYHISEEGLEALKGERVLAAEQLGELWRGGVKINRQNYWCWDQADACFVMK